MNIAEEVRKLAQDRKAIILAHHYQVDEVKDVADYVGDSYGLAVVASGADADIIVLCGVRFMAESCAILAGDKKVLLPVAEAGCPLADSINEDDVRKLRKDNPGVPVVSYVNTDAAIKALSDYCCTSSNAVALVGSIRSERIIFLPDMNLANYVARRTGKELVRWRGFCHVHHQLKAEDVSAARREYPGAVFIAHPECRPEVLEQADEVTSTTGFFKYVSSSLASTFIVGTEEGVISRLKRENPGKIFVKPKRHMICPNMKLTTIHDVYESLKLVKHEVRIEEEVAARARKALERMVSITG